MPHLTRYSVLTLMTLNVSNHNGTLLADHFLDPQSIPSFVLKKSVFDRHLTFSDHVLTIYYRGSG